MGGTVSLLAMAAPAFSQGSILPIHPYYYLISEVAKMISVGLGYFICAVDISASLPWK